MDCGDIIEAGISKDCSSINAAVGAGKDLILVNYDDFDAVSTFAVTNREADDTNNNLDGLTSILLKSGATQYTFEGTDYSVVPNVASEVKEDGDSWFIHSIAFIVYSKKAADRKTLEDLARSRVIGITVDRSTGFYELFGGRLGLKVGAIERPYTGSQNSNFYAVTIQTPDIAVVRETNMAELAVGIVTAV